jgi:transitional endoplasmic reticulum ATPase
MSIVEFDTHIDTTVRISPRRSAEVTGDPLAMTKLDFAFNLVATGILNPRKNDLGEYELIVRLLGKNENHRDGKSRRGKDASSPQTISGLKEMVDREDGVLRKPARMGEPFASNLRVLAQSIRLTDVDVRVIEFALACTDRQMREVLVTVPCDSTVELRAIVAAATGLPLSVVNKTLSLNGRLLSTGLLTLGARGDLVDRIDVDARMVDALESHGLSLAGLMELFLPTAAPPSLKLQDYKRYENEVQLAQRILGKSVAQGRIGTNVLLYGPTGTGKTELARLIASQLNLSLYVTGREDDDGTSPNWSERLMSLVLGNQIVGSGTGLLLFDELEDLFERSEAVGLFGMIRNSGRMSKQWFNALLETNAVPTVWISNSLRGVDPAFLRRFTFVVEMKPPTVVQRRNLWLKHLGDDQLPTADLERLAQRYESSPAQIGGAVAAARLATEGKLEVKTLEAVLDPGDKLLRKSSTKVLPFDAGTYLPEVVNTPVNLDDVARRLSGWRPGDGPGVSLCLYGPPGTGKSAYVRYLAHRMDRPLVVRRVSDILSKYLGDTEQNLAEAFETATEEGSVLLFDEADSFLNDRRQAQRSWEVSITNEFLQQLEDFRGVVACTTNLFRNLDQAALRRFSFKVPFLFLRPEQALRLFEKTLADIGVAGARPPEKASEIARLGNLTPGDFAAVARRFKALGEKATTDQLKAELLSEVQVKEATGETIGF